MATTQKIRDEALKTKYLALIQEFLEEQDEEVLRVKSNEIAIPVVDDEGNERFIVMTVKVPTGERGGEAYDGYSMAEDYQMKQEEKAAKKAEKEAKAAKDKAKREAQALEKARAKAQSEAKAIAEIP